VMLACIRGCGWGTGKFWIGVGVRLLKYRRERTKNSSHKVSSVEIQDAMILYHTRILDDKVDTLHRYGKGSGKLDCIKEVSISSASENRIW